jgi:hypothetical protein
VNVDAPLPVSPACANCGAPLRGPFCSACGQEVKPLDPPVRHFVGELAREFFDVDNRILRSLRRLLFSPGFLTREYFEGRRVGWMSPLKLYLLTSVACFAVLALVGDSGGVQLQADDSGARWLGFENEGELQLAVMAARNAWMPRVMFVLVPLVAWLVGRVRRRSGRNYPAHFVFALHVYAAGFGVRAVTAALAGAAPIATRALLGLTGAYALGYMYVAFRRAYGIGRGPAVRDIAIVAFGSWIALIVGTASIVALTVFGPSIRARIGL